MKCEALMLMLLSAHACTGDVTTVGFINQIIRSYLVQASTTRISAFFCWSSESNSRLLLSFSARHVFASVNSGWQQEEDIAVSHLQEAVVFVLDAGCENSTRLLSMANKKNLFAFPHRWLILEEFPSTSIIEEATPGMKMTTPSPVASDESDEGSPNVPLIPSVPPGSDQNFDSGSNNAASNATALEEDEWTEHLLLDNAISQLEELRSADRVEDNVHDATYGNLSIYIDSKVVIGRRTSQGSFIAVEIFRHGPVGALVSSVIGQWEAGSGLLLDPASLQRVAILRRNMQGTALRATMVVTNNDTLLHLTDLKNRHIDTITKANFALLQNALDMMNATVELNSVTSWGYATNGSWSGMVGYLQRGEADVGATALFFTKDRLDVLEYISMTTPTRAAFVFRQPPLSYVRNVFVLPFSVSVWVSSAVLVTLIACLLYAALRWERRRVTQSRVLTADAPTKASWSDVTLLSLGAVCQQGSTLEPKGVPGRLVTLILFIAVMFLYTSYSASIVSLLQASSSSINTLQDLLQSRLRIGVHDIDYNHHYFKISSEPVRKALYEKKVVPRGKTPRFYSLEDGVKRIRKGLFAFHMEKSPGYQLISETFGEDEKCGFKEIAFLQVIDPYLAIRRGTQYRELLKVGYRRIHERGLQSRTLQQYYSKKPECTSGGSNFVSVGIIEFYPALLVLVYGILCSLLVLVVEAVVHRNSAAAVVSNG